MILLLLILESEADRALRPLPYKLGINAVRRFMFRRVRD